MKNGFSTKSLKIVQIRVLNAHTFSDICQSLVSPDGALKTNY